jgi:hypothetical protein
MVARTAVRTEMRTAVETISRGPGWVVHLDKLFEYCLHI